MKKTISLRAELFAQANQRAVADNRNFSNYIAELIARDASALALAQS